MSWNQTALGLQAMTIEPGDRGLLRVLSVVESPSCHHCQTLDGCPPRVAITIRITYEPSQSRESFLGSHPSKSDYERVASLGIGLAVQSGHKFADNLRVAPESTKDSSAILSGVAVAAPNHLQRMWNRLDPVGDQAPRGVDPRVVQGADYRGDSVKLPLFCGPWFLRECLELGASPPVLRCVEIGVLGELREVGNPSRRRVSRLRGQRRPPASKHQGTLSVGAGASDPSIGRDGRQRSMPRRAVRMRHYGRVYESATKTTNRFVVPIR